MPGAVTSSDLPQPVRSAEGLFSLPTLAYLRASQGERVAIVCYGLGGLLERVEALGGRLTWFFSKDERPVEELLAGETVTFDLIVEYRHPLASRGPASGGAIIEGQHKSVE